MSLLHLKIEPTLNASTRKVHSKDRIFLNAILRFIIMMNEWKKIGINIQLIGEDNFYRKNYWKGRHDVYEYIYVHKHCVF